MKFKMNDITYVIKEVSQKEYKELRVKEDEEDGVEISDVKNGIYQGSTHHTKGIIYIDKNLPHEIKRKTLIHELTHCYIREYITHEEKTYSEEMLADIVANSYDIIHKIVEDYFKYYIQGSDHYLIPKDEFKELFNEMINWKEESKKQKEVIDKAIEFTNKNWGTWCTHHLEYMTELQNILKEVE